MANSTITDLKTLFENILNIQKLTINKVNQSITNCANSLSSYYTKTQIDQFNFLTKNKFDIEKLSDGSYILKIDGEQVGNAITIEKDTFLDSVVPNTTNNTLTFTWNTESGKEEVIIPLSSIADVYKEGNGISISSDGTISTTYKEGNGISISSDNAISVNLGNTGKLYLESTTSGITADGLKSKLDQLEASIEAGVNPGDITATSVTNDSNMPGNTLKDSLNVVYDILSGNYFADLEIEINSLKQLLEIE